MGDRFERNKYLSLQWGNIFDKKSCPIVMMEKEEFEAMKKRIPLPSSAIAGCGEILRTEFRGVNEIRETLRKGGPDAVFALLEKEIELEDAIANQPKQTVAPKVKAPKTIQDIEIEDEEMSSSENFEIDPCRLCKSDRFVVETRQNRTELVCANADCTSHIRE